MAVTPLLPVALFGEVMQSLLPDLTVPKSFDSIDLLSGWKLHSVANCVVREKTALALVHPRLKSDRVSVVFFDFESRWTRLSQDCNFAARLFHNAVSSQAPIPLRSIDSPIKHAAADAFADQGVAGIGGWWLPQDKNLAPQNILWFRMTLDASTLPTWFRHPNSADLQSCVASLLLFLQHHESPGAGSCAHVRVSQLCDNQGVMAASAKMLWGFGVANWGYFSHCGGKKCLGGRPKPQ